MKFPRFWARNGWSPAHLAAAAAMVAFGVFLTFEAWVDIFTIAVGDEESSHIFLVPIVAAWLVWVRRERLRLCRPTGQALGPVLIAAGWLVSSIGYYHAVQAFWHGGAVLVVVGCLLSAVGADVLRRFLPAFVVLVFLVPVPGSFRLGVSLPLQGILANMTWTVFDLVGVPITVNGNLLTINDTPVQVAEACNGLRMVFALVLVSYAFAFGTPLRGYVRFIILALSPVLALSANFIRMIPTVWLYAYGRETVLGLPGRDVAGHFHDVAGWIMLVVAFLMLMAILRALRWALIPVTPYTLAYAE